MSITRQWDVGVLERSLQNKLADPGSCVRSCALGTRKMQTGDSLGNLMLHIIKQISLHHIWKLVQKPNLVLYPMQSGEAECQENNKWHLY